MGDSSGNSSVSLSVEVQNFLNFLKRIFYCFIFYISIFFFSIFFLIVRHISFIAVTRKRSKYNEHECEELPIKRDTVELNTLKDQDESLKTEDESLRRSLLSNSNE